MSLLAVVLILRFWAVYALITKLTPQDPPIEDMEAHLRQLQSLDPKMRRAFIRQDAKRRRAAMRKEAENTKEN